MVSGRLVCGLSLGVALALGGAGCDGGSGRLVEEGAAAAKAGDLTTARAKFTEFLASHREGDVGWDQARMGMAEALVAEVAALAKKGDLEAAYNKAIEVEAGEFASLASVSLETLKNNDAGLKAVIALHSAKGTDDLTDAVNRMIEVAESGTALAAEAKAWLVDKVASVYLPECLGPAAQPKSLPGPDVVEAVQAQCDYVVTYAPGSAEAKKARAAKDGPLQRRLKEVNAEIEREIAKEKAKEAKEARAKAKAEKG